MSSQTGRAKNERDLQAEKFVKVADQDEEAFKGVLRKLGKKAGAQAALCSRATGLSFYALVTLKAIRFGDVRRVRVSEGRRDRDRVSSAADRTASARRPAATAPRPGAYER